MPVMAWVSKCGKCFLIKVDGPSRKNEGPKKTCMKVIRINIYLRIWPKIGRNKR